jgi:SpoVK/Ycf46/Vps4 family AAA+-type ATPase
MRVVERRLTQALARHRTSDDDGSREGTSARVLGCLLTEMDGLVRARHDDDDEFARHFVVIASTNRIDLIDSAMRRPGVVIQCRMRVYVCDNILQVVLICRSKCLCRIARRDTRSRSVISRH